MERVIIVYGSKRGKTSKMAGVVEEELTSAGHLVELRNVYEISPKYLLDFDLIILGSSTWSNGDLQDDFLPFEREMDDISLEGKWATAFGPGNSRFTFFAEAVEILEAKLRSCGARFLIPALKCDELGGRIDDETREWARKLAAAATKLDSKAEIG